MRMGVDFDIAEKILGLKVRTNAFYNSEKAYLPLGPTIYFPLRGVQKI